ncbi:MAG: hypothetical protein LWX56_07570, partial [Ignavibacteria bacterium]|nr:hypothetical protein [Ignavibacteria bacterium]
TEGGNNLVVENLEVLSSRELKTTEQKDSVENNYFGDVEKISEDEFGLAEKLDRRKMLNAYVG